MKRVIRNLLQGIIDDLDVGNTNIDEEESIEIAKFISGLRKDNGISKYAACKYLNVSRATFDNYVREGKIPRGKHEIGFKELRWYKKDLDEFIRKSRDNHSLLNNAHNRVC